MIKFPKNWEEKQRIEYLQRKIIIFSIAYYEYDVSMVEDNKFDDISHQLVAMQKNYPNIQDTRYGYMMYDFDGSTGFDLPSRLTHEDREFLTDVANAIMRAYLNLQKEEEKPKKKNKLF